jgi:hypothetical protein
MGFADFLSPKSKATPRQEETSSATTAVPSLAPSHHSSTNLPLDLEKEPVPATTSTPTSPPPSSSSENLEHGASSEKALEHSSEGVKGVDGHAQLGTALAAEEKMEQEIEEKTDDESEYPKGAKLAVITMALCFSVFLVALDNTIIATAIPRITDHFKALDDGMISPTPPSYDLVPGQMLTEE